MPRLLAAALLLSLCTACASADRGWCREWADCTDRDRAARQQCQEGFEEDEATALQSGCRSEWNAWTRCYARASTCQDGFAYIPADGACDDRLFALAECSGPVPVN